MQEEFLCPKIWQKNFCDYNVLCIIFLYFYQYKMNEQLTNNNQEMINFVDSKLEGDKNDFKFNNTLSQIEEDNGESSSKWNPNNIESKKEEIKRTNISEDVEKIYILHDVMENLPIFETVDIHISKIGKAKNSYKIYINENIFIEPRKEGWFNYGQKLNGKTYQYSTEDDPQFSKMWWKVYSNIMNKYYKKEWNILQKKMEAKNK